MESAEDLSTRKPKILTQRVMEQFFDRVLREDRPINSITVVSPWISDWEAGRVGLTQLIDRIDRQKIRTMVLTRPPLETWHEDALRALKSSKWVSISLLQDLHAKIFLCEAVPVGFGLVGSANLTAKSLENFEVAVLFEGRGVFSPLLKELHIFAWNDLRRLSKSFR